MAVFTIKNQDGILKNNVQITKEQMNEHNIQQTKKTGGKAC